MWREESFTAYREYFMDVNAMEIATGEAHGIRRRRDKVGRFL